MESVVTTCGGCGKAIRIRRPEVRRKHLCPICGTLLTTPTSGAIEGTRRSAPAHRRAFIGSLGLLELTLLMMISAPAAVWSSAAWTTSAAASPPLVFRESAPTPRLPESLDRKAAMFLQAATTNGVNLVGQAVCRLLEARPLARGLWFLGGLSAKASAQEGVATPARGDEVAASPALLTPPDFGAPAIDELQAKLAVPEERRFLLRDEDGRQIVARLHGSHNGKTVVMLPDGRLGVPSMLVPTDEPFKPLTADEMSDRLLTGPFSGFKLHRTKHYLILYQSDPGQPDGDAFAKSNGVLLEDLYERLSAAFRNHDMSVHEAEFPLVAVIFKKEEDFRAFRPVAPDVQAYYEIYTNRIFLYETPSGRRSGPEVDALLKPQMTAHEGTHQILQNIGVQPRLSDWPLWLVEGLAEYCATPAPPRKGVAAWDGLGQINNLHMATIREIEDPVSLSMRGQDVQTKSLFRDPGQPLVEAMIRRNELTPTEYALAWAITHYLAMKRVDDFTRFLRIMGAAAPLEPRTADDHVKTFREVFGADLGKLDKTINAYLTKLTKQKGYDPMPYYAVLFEQPLPNGRLRRAAMVSQSPQLIKQWIDEMSNPAAGLPNWQATPFPSRGRATLAVQEWIRTN
ncbi:DUF1570 domain-containing protein [Paludisphaera rhizosphaerae]|uniref:DUF1570 domain-containing protein n=1 Tax=Paludisphaera rhizosphaerae TaxID=2711216 RepID=UPI0013ED5E34|nr:DUF1570 domain-containing protein [Paludisphaera rhizosphaerae]